MDDDRLHSLSIGRVSLAEIDDVSGNLNNFYHHFHQFRFGRVSLAVITGYSSCSACT